VQFPAPSLETWEKVFDGASNTTAGAAVLPIPKWAVLPRRNEMETGGASIGHLGKMSLPIYFAVTTT
jgi:hypothetical protein